MRTFRPLACVVGVLVIHGGTALGQNFFGLPSPVAGNGPAWVDTGDLNGDGRLDIVVTKNLTVGVAVLLAKADGLFKPAVAVSFAQYTPSDVTLGDLDLDGDLDLAVCGQAPSSVVRRYLNDGTGKFGASSTMNVDPYCEAVEIGDVTGDGVPDLVVANAVATSNVQVLAGLGAGAFASPVTHMLSPAQWPRGLALVDLDGDADLDVVTANDDYSVAVLQNLGSGAFAPPARYPTSLAHESIVIGDWNEDGAPDIALASSGGGPTVLLNDGLGGLLVESVQAGLGSTCNDLDSGDFDRDGHLDLATTHYGKVAVLLGAGDGSFALTYSASVGALYGIAVGDASGDDLLDLIAPAYQDDKVHLIVGDGAGGFGAPAIGTHGSHIGDVAAGDVDLDGISDLVVAHRNSALLGVCRGLGGGAFATEHTYPAVGGSDRLLLARIDADAYLDAYVVGLDAVPYVYFGDGQGGFRTAAPTAAWLGMFDIALADVTGDGLADLAHTYMYTGSGGYFHSGYRVGLGDGSGGFQVALYAETGDIGASVLLEDFTGDGLRDVLYSGYGGIRVFASLGGGSFAAPILSAVVPGFSPLAGDIDGDGDLDLIGHSTAEIAIAPSLGNGAFGAPTYLAGVYSFTDTVVADFDGDGAMDFVGSADDGVRGFRGDGNGSLIAGSGPMPHGLSGSSRIAALDANADGNADLAIVATNDDELLLFLSIGQAGGPTVYCTSKTTSNGCVPSLSFSGTSSASSTSGFDIASTGMINGKAGLFTYSLAGRVASPFLGGTLCVKPPLLRTPVSSTGGNPPPNDCSGSLTLDFNAFAHGLAGGNPNPALLIAGTSVTLQAWGRDSGYAPPNNVQLSNALDFFVKP